LSRGMRWRAAACACVLTAAAGAVLMMPPSLSPWLNAQSMIFERLLPDWQLQQFGLVRHDAVLQLRAQAAPLRHLVVDGRLVAPGQALQAYTPAGQAGGWAAPALLAAAYATLRHPRRAFTAMGSGFVGAAVLYLVAPTWLLVGLLCSATVGPLAEPTAAALHVAVAVFLLHGGAWFLAACAALGTMAVASRP